jgi:phage shock protein A
MARHPDVKQSDIINAAMTLEKAGKTPNPGAIRAALGHRGGLLRIKSVWAKYQKSKDNNLIDDMKFEFSFADLPDDISKDARLLIQRAEKALEQVVVHTFLTCQQTFDNRLQAIEHQYQAELAKSEDAEVFADREIKKMESDCQNLKRKFDQLAKQNTDLLIENAQLNGRLSVHDTQKNHIATQSK